MSGARDASDEAAANQATTIKLMRIALMSAQEALRGNTELSAKERAQAEQDLQKIESELRELDERGPN